MHDAPTLTVDWDSGEGQLHLGQLADAPPRLRLDVLADWKDQIELVHRQAEAQLFPQREAEARQEQKRQNRRRRELCERLSGQTVLMAEPLVNGDVLLHLASGRCIVLYARKEDVKLEMVPEPGHARRLAAADHMGDVYLRED